MDFFNDGYEIEVRVVNGEYFAYKSGRLLATASSWEGILEIIEDGWISLLSQLGE